MVEPFFFKSAQSESYDIATDALATLKDVLTMDKETCATFLYKNYRMVFKSYNGLLRSKQYVTKRLSIKLLGEILLDRSNFKIMKLYIEDVENLKTLMHLFAEHHKQKIFVHNPSKPRPIIDALVGPDGKNKKELCKFLLDPDAFGAGDDDQFEAEKMEILATIEKLS